MRTLDRYVVRQFLLNTLIVSVVLLGLFALVDFIIDVDEFLQAGSRWSAARWEEPTTMQVVLTTLRAIVDYYTPLIVLLYVYFCGLFVVAGVGFTFANLVRTRELTAMVTCGVSMFRVAAPVLVVGFALIALSLPVQEYIIPSMASRLARSKSQLKHGRTVRTFPVRFAYEDLGAGRSNLISASAFDVSEPRPVMRNVTIIQREPSGKTARRIIADAAVWDEARGEWQLENGYAAAPPMGNDSAGGRGALAFEEDIEEVRTFRTQVSPDVLMARREPIYLRLLSLGDLIELRTNTAADRAQIASIIWSRFSMVVVNVLILVMALPIFLQREPGNLLVQAGKAAGLSLGAWGGALVLLQLGGEWLNPVTGAWLPVVVYLPISAAMLLTVRT